MHFVGYITPDDGVRSQTISVCVVIQAGTSREVIARRRFRCADEERILAFFEELGQFEVVVEARPATSGSFSSLNHWPGLADAAAAELGRRCAAGVGTRRQPAARSCCHYS